MEQATIPDPAPPEGVLGLVVDANAQLGSSPAAASATARIDAMKAELLAEMPLQELRRARALSQQGSEALVGAPR